MMKRWMMVAWLVLVVLAVGPMWAAEIVTVEVDEGELNRLVEDGVKQAVGASATYTDEAVSDLAKRVTILEALVEAAGLELPGDDGGGEVEGPSVQWLTVLGPSPSEAVVWDGEAIAYKVTTGAGGEVGSVLSFFWRHGGVANVDEVVGVEQPRAFGVERVGALPAGIYQAKVLVTIGSMVYRTSGGWFVIEGEAGDGGSSGVDPPAGDAVLVGRDASSIADAAKYQEAGKPLVILLPDGDHSTATGSLQWDQVTIKAAPGAEPRMTGQLLIRNSNDVTIEGLRFAGTPEQPILSSAIKFGRTKHRDVLVKDCTVEWFAYGMSIEASEERGRGVVVDHLITRHLRPQDAGQQKMMAIYAYRQDNLVIKNCVGLTDSNGQVEGIADGNLLYCHWLYADACYDITVENCLIDQPVSSGVKLDYSGWCRDTIIRGNRGVNYSRGGGFEDVMVIDPAFGYAKQGDRDGWNPAAGFGAVHKPEKTSETAEGIKPAAPVTFTRCWVIGGHANPGQTAFKAMDKRARVEAVDCLLSDWPGPVSSGLDVAGITKVDRPDLSAVDALFERAASGEAFDVAAVIEQVRGGIE